uniref:Ig-like domain-containing protein n=1 Tax=Astyanax mexicanus TaxID=7994 RepID=W5LEQ0_ASTMX
NQIQSTRTLTPTPTVSNKGLVVCFDVIGYSRGSVIINCSYQQDKGNDKYFCKESTNQCVNLKSDQRQNSWDHKGRVSLINLHGGLMVTYRDLSLEDAGLYQCGESGVWNHTVNLKVKTDSCCVEPKPVIGYLGETVTISFSYPEEFQGEYKLPYKLDGQILTALIKTSLSQKDRFSISDNRRSGVFSVRISDVREEDGGVYSCAVAGGGDEVDSCCVEPKPVIGYLGETVTISFSYPEEFQAEDKLLYKLDGQILSSLIETNLSQKDRFSISDYRRSRVTVRISDVREEDGGVYYCAVGGGGDEVGYYSLFSEIHLQEGSVFINCSYQQDKGNDKYFCKESTNQNSWDHKGRVSLINFPGGLMVIYRDLSVEDAGLYQCGESGVWNQTVNLKVKTDPCCLGPKTVIGYLGETVTINCSYPEEFQTENKLLYKLDGRIYTALMDTNLSQKDRFSISEDRSSRVISVRISDVREEDGGVYYCAVGDGGDEVGYYSLFSEIHLQSLNPNTNQSDSVYQSLNPKNQPIRFSLPEPKSQNQPIRFSLPEPKPNTNQSDSVYQSLNPNQSDSVYQSRNPNQSDSVYQNLNPTPTNQIQSTRV